MTEKQESIRERKELRHAQCHCEQVYRVFDSGIVGDRLIPLREVDREICTPCDPDEGGEGGGA